MKIIILIVLLLVTGSGGKYWLGVWQHHQYGSHHYPVEREKGDVKYWVTYVSTVLVAGVIVIIVEVTIKLFT